MQRSGHPERRQHADRRRRSRQGHRADLARAAGRQALAPLKATVDVAGLPLSGSAAIDGTARGRYRMVKSVAVFRLERTSGDVAVSYPGGRQTYGMGTLAGALVPDGAADLTCRGDSLTIEAENLTLDLRRVKR